MRVFIFCLLGGLLCLQLNAQVILTHDDGNWEKSVVGHTLLADAGSKNYSPQEVQSNTANLSFKKLTGIYGNLGFSTNNYWAKFDLQNTSNSELNYFLEAGEAMTDHLNCYIFDKAGNFIVQKNGDNLDFKNRGIDNRRLLFKIVLKPKEKKQVILEIKNDGERNSLPISLLTSSRLLNQTYHQQLFVGLFYGILFVIFITYLFFYLALNEVSFLYYSLYVLFVGLCQFALDGFFHQYLDRNSTWVNQHAVLIFAILAAFFFGKYSEIILEINLVSKKLMYAFRLPYILLGITLFCIIFIPKFLPFAYPVVNFLMLAGMVNVLFSVCFLLYKKIKIDSFFIAGIIVLFLTISIVIFSNFGIFDHWVSTDNITKFGIGLEIIFLSLLMAMRIYHLKSAKEKLQTIALQRSNEINDMKSFFLSNMSHELRTPLNAILGTASILADETKDESIKNQCDIINDASETLISSVNDILDFSMIERGELKLDASSFKPYDILLKTATLFEKKALTNKLMFSSKINFDTQTIVIGDAIRLKQIVHNLLSNAVKFTPSGSINFEASCDIKNNHFYLRMRIADTGIGISKEKLEKGFQMFSQSIMDNKRRFGGFGIGLCVVNALVNLHKGYFKVESNINIGTNCLIELDYPLVKIEKIIDPKILIPIQSNKQKHILVVEDNPINQTVIKMILKKWENTVISIANDGSEALAILKETPSINLILLDLQMPVMDGYEALTAIRSGSAGDNHILIPIIVLTADVMDSTKDKVFELGANDFMTKPVDKTLLHEKVQTLLNEDKMVKVLN